MAARKPARRTGAKKGSATAAKRTVTPKKAAKKRSPAKNPKVKQSSSKLKRPTALLPAKQRPVVEPGPPVVPATSVEEPVEHEEAIGIVIHYYSHLGVAVVQLNKGSLRTGDRIHILGHTSDFTQSVGSMEYEHAHVDSAEAGQRVGIKVKEHAREHDIVYLVQ